VLKRVKKEEAPRPVTVLLICVTRTGLMQDLLTSQMNPLSSHHLPDESASPATLILETAVMISMVRRLSVREGLAASYQENQEKDQSYLYAPAWKWL